MSSRIAMIANDFYYLIQSNMCLNFYNRSLPQTYFLESAARDDGFTFNPKIAVIATCHSVLAKAKRLALRLDLPFISQKQATSHFQFLLTATPDRLELRENSNKNPKPILVDFLAPKLNYRIKHGGGKNQLIAKAVGIKNKKKPQVIDATAGFGIDAFVLASLGCEVLMLERSPIMSALLEDGLERLMKNPKMPSLKIGMQTIEANDYFSKILKDKSLQPDVIYLDPMYPQQYKTALNKKVMRVLHQLVGKDDDAAKLLEPALTCAKNRVVVKRPKYADSLGLLKPDLQFFSRGSSRYDIYFPKNS